ncbi:hypothetical protein SKAU_G00122520 [Synaphobranchus kaupii]|uniref:A-kinase anchor protein 2 C-terminal domain-containing protein n=1 Tax=Synaphobranchus kaupii TaxID=118154 RepID=A0A9Q1FPC1_SYNKA|nr:hypothetical protein SKAU_G00122520 [Synaphobranchus kaupii]
METNNNSVTIATEAITSPQSSVSQDDWGSGSWMEDSDSANDMDSGRDNSPAMTKEAPRAEQEETWPDVTQSEWLMEEPPEVTNAETPDGSVREVEVFHFPRPCADQTWSGEGDTERESRQGPAGEASPTAETGISQPSLQQQQEGLLQHGIIADSQQGELLLHRLCLLQQKQEAQQVFEGTPPLATVALEPASQRPGCHGCACVVVREWTERRREGEEKAGEQTGGEGQQSVTGLHTGEEGKGEERDRGAESTQRGETKAQGGREVQINPPVHLRDSRMEVLNGEDNQSDSGVSTDFSPGSTMELCSIPFAPDDPGTAPTPLNETPIEREIRRAVEREQSLRRARGLAKTQEFVEIPLRKPVLSPAGPSRSGKGEGMDRQFAGKKMQKEISVEARREEVLVRMGKVPGVYDKGSVRQLRERKQLFEAFQEKRGTSGALASQSKRPSSSASDISALGSQKGHCPASGPVLERGHSLESITHKQNQQQPGSGGCREEGFSNTHVALCGPTLSEGTSSQVIILENNLVLPPPAPNPDGLLHPSHSVGSLSEAHAVTVVDSGTMVEGGRVVGEAEGREKEAV